MKLVDTSYSIDDVVILCKDVSDVVYEGDIAAREKARQTKNRHYAMDLPKEQPPTTAYMDLFNQLASDTNRQVATQVAIVGEKIRSLRTYENVLSKVILVSLLRAGLPFGVMLKRHIERYWGSIPHVAVSIIRDVGIDTRALEYILECYGYDSTIVFVDGWVGKGRIRMELDKAMAEFQKTHPPINWKFAVISDPVGCSDISGTNEDILLPSACLNSTVSGLVSRSVYNPEFIGDSDYHGAKFYKEFKDCDVSVEYVEDVCQYFDSVDDERAEAAENPALAPSVLPFTAPELDDEGVPIIIRQLQEKYDVPTIDYIKPGIGETMRVLLRRVPDRILISSSLAFNMQQLMAVVSLCRTKGVPIEFCDLGPYLCCGVIKHIVGEVSAE